MEGAQRISVDKDLKGYIEGRRRGFPALRTEASPWRESMGNPGQRAGVMVSSRHGRPTEAVVPRGAGCSQSRLVMLTRACSQEGSPAHGRPDHRTAAPSLISCLPALWAKVGFALRL